MRLLIYLSVALGYFHYRPAHSQSFNEPSDRPSIVGTDLEASGSIQKFISRPDIKPAKWNIHIYDKERIAPGYWFVAPMEHQNRKPDGAWTGPHIFDGDGQLIWSGSHLFDNIFVVDFKPITVNDSTMLFMHYAFEGSGYILDHHYQVKQKVHTGTWGKTLNTHDFRTLDQGTRFLFVQRNHSHASTDGVGIGFDGECNVSYPRFVEIDARTNDTLFDWNGIDIVPLQESTLIDPHIRLACVQEEWDYMHTNSIDKFNDGHYLLSARHSDTIYKISKDDGSIIWRLFGPGGNRSDFEMVNLNFTRQHHARLHEHNDTHAVMSLLDNAIGQDKQAPSSKWSRALKVALRFDTMTAELIWSVDHPQREHNDRRGSHQILPNGNSFVGWSERALHSEHTPDGKIIMEAELEWSVLGTYRAFKYPFIGEPQYPPDIHSIAETRNGSTTTTVHVSWNGATEVASWKLYKTGGEDGKTVEITEMPRLGFETTLTYAGFANYVYAQAIGSDGRPLEYGKSDTIHTISVQEDWSPAFVEETAWLQQGLSTNTSIGTLELIIAVLPGFLTFLVLFYFVRRRWHGSRTGAQSGSEYTQIAIRDAAEFDEAELGEMSETALKRRSEEELSELLPGEIGKDDAEEAGGDARPPLD